MCLFGIPTNILKCQLLKISCHNIIEDVLFEKNVILLFLFAMVEIENKSEICYKIPNLRLLNYSISGEGCSHIEVNVTSTSSRLGNMTYNAFQAQ